MRGLLFAALALPWALLTARFRFVTDDAFISFRYARNLVLGHGLRYNLGGHAPVEGYSNFLWVMVDAALEGLGASPARWVPLVSAACGLVLLWLVFDRLRRRFGVSPLAAGLAVLSLSAFPPFAMWSTGGLETMPFALLVFVSFDRIVLDPRRPTAETGILALALCLIRVEGLFWLLLILALGLLVRRGTDSPLRPAWTFGLVVGAGLLAYHAWRLAWFGELWPAPVRVKAELDPVRLARGFRYVATWFLVFLSPFVVFPGAVLAVRRHDRLAVAILALAFPVWAILVTGDFMAMGRLLVPGAAFQTILFALLLDRLAARRRAVAVGIALAVTGIAVLPAWNVHVVPRSVRERAFFRWGQPRFESELEWWRDHHVANVERGTVTGKALAAYARARFDGTPSYVNVGIGVVGYWSNYTTYDCAGLVSPEVADRAVGSNEKPGMPGHDKVVPRDWFLEKAPTVLDAAVLTGVAPCDVAHACRSTAAGLRQRAVTDPRLKGYVVDFFHVPAAVLADADTWLVTVTRLERGSTPPRAWRELEERLRELCPGG